MRRYLTVFFGLACAFALAACNLTDGVVVEQPVGFVQESPGAHRPVSPPYVLGPNDRVNVKVYGETEITNDYEVDGSGFISIPLAGRVKASGLTTTQLAHAIRAQLSDGIVRDPKVAVEVSSYAPYYILGEVKQGGEFVYKNGLTVLDAVAAAGGFTYRADERNVLIRRAGESVDEIYPTNAPIPVYPGDNIRIPERYF
jgi:protein involved in polysaccharide export with SLBB domain